MKAHFLLTFLAGSMLATAQTDSTSTKNGVAISIGVDKDGPHARIEQEGDTTRKGNEPTIIETRRKRITITTERKEWLSPTDSAAERLEELRKERRAVFTYWGGWDVGVNTLMGTDGDTDLGGDAEFMQIDHGRSRFLSFNVWEQKIEFGTHHVGLLTGMGLEFVNYHLKNNVLLSYNADSIFGLPVEQPEFDKNKLRQLGLRVPLMLEFNTKRAKLPTVEEIATKKTTGFNSKGNVHLAAGVVGTWYFDTMYKQKYELNDDTKKDRDKGDYLLLPYRLAASVRLGYGSLNLFAEYALTPLFNEGKGPELTPLTVGITILGWD